MTMPGRQYNGGNYRHGFNGMEKDDELKGSGNSYDFGARVYDPRLARWLSSDKYESEYPIVFIDPDGNKIRVGKQYQNDFKKVMVRAFGEKALTDFYFDENDHLQFAGDVNSYTLNERIVLVQVLELISEENVAEFVFAKTDAVLESRGESTDDYGGEATYDIVGGVRILIDPDEEASFVDGVEEKHYFLKNKEGSITKDASEALKDEFGEPIESKKTYYGYSYTTLSKYRRVFHGMGHALDRINKAKAIDLENQAGAIEKKVKFEKTQQGEELKVKRRVNGEADIKSKPSEEREYDSQHSPTS